jgi:hypothetical protein
MKPCVLLIFAAAALLLVCFGHADEREAPAIDMELAGVLVDNALELAEQDDPLRRAELCRGLAQKLTMRLQTAARRQDRERTVALGEMLQLVMVEGVAETLNQARVEATDTPKQAEVKNAAAQITAVAVQAEKSLAADDAGPPEFAGLMKEIQGKIQEARGLAEERSQGKGKGKGPPPWAKKGKKGD